MKTIEFPKEYEKYVILKDRIIFYSEGEEQKLLQFISNKTLYSDSSNRLVIPKPELTAMRIRSGDTVKLIREKEYLAIVKVNGMKDYDNRYRVPEDGRLRLSQVWWGGYDAIKVINKVDGMETTTYNVGETY